MAGENDNVVGFPTAARATPAGRRLIPARLREARKLMRLSQVDLADKIGVSRQAVSAYERGDKAPDTEPFQRMAEVLRQPAAFFTKEDSPTFGEYSVKFYRKFGADTVRRNEACDVLGDWFVQVSHYLDQFVNYPPVNVPEASPSSPDHRYTAEEINEIADTCRRTWGLGVGPISNVLSLLESKGIAICKYELQGEKIEAFSFWNGPRPFIFMASEKESAVRARYDLAHELGHLVLHRWVDESELEDVKTLKKIEAEADMFAGAFLLPRTSFPNEVYTLRLDAFVELKRRWRVSIQAMVHRCADLGLATPDQALNLYKQISFRKWRTREPLDNPTILAIEQPRVLRRAIEMVLEAKKKHPEEISADLGLNQEVIELLCNLLPDTLRYDDNVAPVDPILK
jgi:Zn-dependent peptidase ImmA (M78 family)/transcriptional regulator with XRE-family HTH domain